MTSAFRLARVDELRHLVEQREMVPRLGRGCLDAPQVEGTIYRLYCEKLEAPSAIKIVEMLIIIGVVG